VVGGEDPRAVHLQRRMPPEGDALAGVLAQAVAKQPIDVVHRKLDLPQFR
jgi:hypothetical protein